MPERYAALLCHKDALMMLLPDMRMALRHACCWLMPCQLPICACCLARYSHIVARLTFTCDSARRCYAAIDAATPVAMPLCRHAAAATSTPDAFSYARPPRHTTAPCRRHAARCPAICRYYFHDYAADTRLTHAANITLRRLMLLLLYVSPPPMPLRLSMPLIFTLLIVSLFRCLRRADVDTPPLLPPCFAATFCRYADI